MPDARGLAIAKRVASTAVIAILISVVVASVTAASTTNRHTRIRPPFGRSTAGTSSSSKGARSRQRILVLLRVNPNPVALQEHYAVTLQGARPQEWLTFTWRRRSAGGALGRSPWRHQVDAAGLIRMRSSPFTRFGAMSRWVVTVEYGSGGDLVSASLDVAGLLLRPRSQHVTMGKSYPFRLYTHRGANLSVDFDHRFWDLTDPQWSDQPNGAGPHEGLSDPFQLGIMTLVDSRHTRFDFVLNAWTPGQPGATDSIRCTRPVGPKIAPSFCD